jgi:glycosyltransferase involved in cell wall biosynthesis
VISLITPNYNGERWIGDCLDSVANQTINQSEVEMILVDDGSVDNSRAIAKDYKSDIPGLKIISHEHTGKPGELRNIGIRRSIGEYVLFLDSDDFLGNEALERLDEFTRASESDIIAFELDGLNRSVPRSMLKETREEADVIESGLYKTLGTWKMCRREFLSDSGIRFNNISRGEDTLFFAEAMLRAKKLSILSGYPFYTVRGREDGTSITQKEWDQGTRIDVAKKLAETALNWSRNDNIANHFLIRVFNTDAIGVLESPTSTNEIRSKLKEELGQYWSRDVKHLIYTDENRKILESFFEGDTGE